MAVRRTTGPGRRTVSGVIAVAAIVVAVGAVVVVRRGDDARSPAVPPVLSAPPGTLMANAVVVHVVDGDTVDLRIGNREERVRLIGIDTPESVHPNRPVECYGPEASARTAALLAEGTPVYLERDIEPRDDYGRLLGYVHRVADGLFVNLNLVEEGYATPLTIEPNTTYADRFVAAATAAERADRGLWGACDG